MEIAKQPELAGPAFEQFRSLLLRHMEGVVTLDGKQVGALWNHWRQYERWNRVLNLSAVRDLEGAVVKHYCESLFLASCLPAGPVRIVDVGSGAGFPGFPIAVLRGDCQVLLVESHRRKAVFLQEVTRQAPNARVFVGRAEQVPDHFDWLVSRAVAWRDLAVHAARLADHVGLLASSVDAQSLVLDSAFRWKEPFPLLWGKDGVVLVADVSRGTS
ncbi:MAG TPA: RsmG family class I SAM-dependent methyltransferase [Bryobacteraceae bacterium]|nr:RsmG family class I SAM-dependent methyltransferase [Bryobacteraceae bacterium]